MTTPAPIGGTTQPDSVTSRAISAVAIAQIVARNIVPLVGVLFLGWHAGNVLLLYFLDTLLAIGVMLAGLMGAVPRWAPSIRPIGPIRTIAATLFLVVFFSLPLGVPLFIMLFGVNDVTLREVLTDTGFRTGAIMQAAAAIWSYLDLARALREHSPEELRVKRRFALVFLRWVGVLMVIYTSIGIQLPVLVIATYVAISIWEEIAPDRFLMAIGDREDVDAASRPKQGTDGRRAGGKKRLRQR